MFKVLYKKPSILLSICAALCSLNIVYAQKISINFPKFQGSEFAFVLYQGQKADTVQQSSIPFYGSLTLAVPETLKGYEGVASWTLAQGGGLQFIISREDFSISCTESQPTPKTIIYKGSAENDSLLAFNAEQADLFNRINTYFQTQQSYSGNNALLAELEKTYPPLKQAFEDYQQKLARSPLYAAFFVRLNNYLQGIGSKLYLPDERQLYVDEISRFISDELDMKRLYTSGLWNHFISMSFELFKGEPLFAEKMITILKRTADKTTFTRLSNDLMMICEQFGWDDAREIIVNYLIDSGRVEQPEGLVRVAMMLNKAKSGSVAPELVGFGTPKGALLIFYESGCDHCRAQLDTLSAKYDKIKALGLDVISISTDSSEEVFLYHSANFPWKTKLCDYQGFNGVNFTNYGVFGTPTLFYIGSDGKVIDRKAGLSQIKSLKLD
jgi:thiol-disulfide isomerase/thioredoxin